MTFSSRYTPVAPYRQMLGDLRGKYPHGELARRLNVTPRTLHRAMNAEAVNITRKLADAILFEAGVGQEPEPTHLGETVTGADVFAYSQTARGKTFVAQCRRPNQLRVAA